ncbi:microsomal signal peptidase 25 kDa subunit-domain-containing protein [Dichomitus squalens]|uniref:Signal peptidase complex subunit 2 n=1 Tax=Dichomitus squalens TaxID=114155 RepID=A0A4Q9PGR1_9APHY|nr:microsomal signal peptidase 25 kDa subunit-domain-containing protein [Dichomitus squalens]TBU51756.1 microsomal signal peptidase 25 kDa subunit-domain-containing protein [Dichomitus squalens]
MAPRSRKSGPSPSPAPPTSDTDAAPPLSPKDDSSVAHRSSIDALLVPVAGEEREEVKVNNASVADMKHACDDALKRFLSRPDLFKQIHTHTDVRLALGWLSVLIAGGTGLYGWRVPFEQSKPAVWAGVILYVILTITQTLYAYFIEGDTVFVGRRKTFDKRIVTERITITAKTTPSTPSSPPGYALGLAYVRSASGGKTLLGKGRASEERKFTEFFDERGVLDQERFERWVGQVVGRVMDGKAE